MDGEAVEKPVVEDAEAVGGGDAAAEAAPAPVEGEAALEEGTGEVCFFSNSCLYKRPAGFQIYVFCT